MNNRLLIVFLYTKTVLKSYLKNQKSLQVINNQKISILIPTDFLYKEVIPEENLRSDSILPNLFMLYFGGAFTNSLFRQ
ncbi:hypothetical protein IJ00_10145 [Calothrix sp. 336/3]|nr:hypothetical protein IJ00_10145 [Calothrix sp. 336/3]